MVKVTINDREVDVPPGTLVVDAATAAGIEIPVFCYHPKMKPAGACRMCLVEIDKIRGLPAACTTRVSEGMVVKTTTPPVLKQQRGLLEFLLINHPLDCPVCDQGGECPLQDTTFKFGPGTSRFIEPKRHFVKPIALSENVLLDRERCIMCLRCVRFQNEIAYDDALGIVHRGAAAEIGVFPGHHFDSPFSGNTIDICPVGALTSAKYRFHARPWDIRNVSTICPHCSVGCNTSVTIRDVNALRVLPRENTPVDDGWICDTGRFTYEYIQSQERLTSPLLRRDGQLVPVSWPEALAAVGDRLRGIMAEHGPAAVGGVISPRQTNEELYAFQKLFRAVIGSNNVDSRATGTGDTDAVLQRLLGYRAATGSIADLEKSGVIFAIGTRTIEEQPILNLRVKKATSRGAALILAEPDKSDLDKVAKQTLRYAAGAESALLKAMLHVIVRDNLIDQEFATSHPDIVDSVRQSMSGDNLDALAESAGLPTDAITLAATTLAQATSATILYSAGWSDSGDHAEEVELLVRLAQVTGNIGRDGGGIDRLVLEANAQGTIDVGAMPHLLPGHRALDDPEASATFEARWQAAVPTTPGLDTAGMLRAARAGTLKALYVVGTDVVGSAEAERVDGIAAALKQLDFLVVQDVFLTETAMFADVVLPGVTYVEKDGTFTNLERRIQRLRVGLKRPGDARPDWQIIQDVANGVGGKFYYSGPREIMREIAAVVPAYGGVTYARLGLKGLQWPCPTLDHPGSTLLYERPAPVAAR